MEIIEYGIMSFPAEKNFTHTTITVVDQDNSDHIALGIHSESRIVLYEAPPKEKIYSTSIAAAPSGEWISHTYTDRIWDFSKASITVLDCLRCGNPLLAKEIKAKQHHCAPCKRLVEAAEHQERVSRDIHRANVRGGL